MSWLDFLSNNPAPPNISVRTSSPLSAGDPTSWQRGRPPDADTTIAMRPTPGPSPPTTPHNNSGASSPKRKSTKRARVASEAEVGEQQVAVAAAAADDVEMKPPTSGRGATKKAKAECEDDGGEKSGEEED